MKAIILILLTCLSTPLAFSYTNVALFGQRRYCGTRGRSLSLKLNERIKDGPMPDKDDENDKNDSSSSFFQSLSQRIAEVEQSESYFVSGLQKRVKSVAQAQEFDSAVKNDSSNSGEPIVVQLPVVCLDALLPNQRIAGSTTDPTFCNFLRALGLGGTFVMTSLNSRQRKVRRFGVVARIELVDVDSEDPNKGNPEDEKNSSGLLSTPTAVTFIIAGKRRCEILGVANGMKDSIGRWRRGYDPDGEESRLGWGDERFVDKSDANQFDSDLANTFDDAQWSDSKVVLIDEDSEDAKATSDAIAKATYLIPLVERWIALASDQTTYDNVDVVAGTRRKSGEPGLSINASALIRKVQQDLGPMPSPESPSAFAVWGAALINPLPALGVATEVRGAVLEADGAEKKLGVFERCLIKSINNLDGTRPLNM